MEQTKVEFEFLLFQLSFENSNIKEKKLSVLKIEDELKIEVEAELQGKLKRYVFKCFLKISLSV